MTPLFWTVLAATIIILLYPAGFLAGFARGRNVKVLTMINEFLRGEEDGSPGSPKAP